MRHYLIMDHRDNVAIAVEPLSVGEEVADGLIIGEAIPQGHKLALHSISKGEAVIRYGVTIGYAIKDISRGALVNEDVLRLPEMPALDAMRWGARSPKTLPKAPLRTFSGYPDAEGGFAGTRNILAIHTTVQCVAGVLDRAVERIKAELLPKYPCVDDVWPVKHAYGCGVAIDAPQANVPIRTLRNLVHHPNFGGEVMCVSLGCEKLTVGRLLDEKDNRPENVIILQECRGYNEMINTILAMADRKLKRLNERRREEISLAHLMVGLQCGGSDAFSGVTANPSAGYASDLLVEAGATVLFSEVTEVRDGVHLISERCENQAVANKLAREMVWYDDYLKSGMVDRSANTTPGNKKGGLSNIVEKSMGSIIKSGTAPIVEVISPAEKPSKHGLIFAATPASDFVCGSCQLASGIGLQVFLTGRGTPYGLAAVPVIKVCSHNEMKERWPDLIDVNAGPIATGNATISEIGEQLFRMIVNVASGRVKPYAEQHALHNDLCIFNPAPIT